MTTTAPDVDVLQLLDLDWHHETPCTAPIHYGDRPAARWRMVQRCGCVHLICDECCTDLRRYLEASGSEEISTSCTTCRALQICLVRELVVSIEPLT